MSQQRTAEKQFRPLDQADSDINSDCAVVPSETESAWPELDKALRDANELKAVPDGAINLLLRCQAAMQNFFSNEFDGGAQFSVLTSDIPAFIARTAETKSDDEEFRLRNAALELQGLDPMTPANRMFAGVRTRDCLNCGQPFDKHEGYAGKCPAVETSAVVATEPRFVCTNRECGYSSSIPYRFCPSCKAPMDSVEVPV